MKKFFFDCGTRDATASFGIFALRLMVGLMMLIGHGIPKLLNFSTYQKTFYVPDIFPLSLMSHAVSLSACIAGEVVASVLIIVGLATRPAAFVFGFSMVVAAFGVHGAAPWFQSATPGATKELALMYLIPAIAIILSGAGSYSLDATLYRDPKRRRW